MSASSRVMFIPAIGTLVFGLSLFTGGLVVQAQTSPNGSAPSAAAKDDGDRPRLRRGGYQATDAANDSNSSQVLSAKPTMPAGPEVAHGLMLPARGRVWALDTFEGKPELVHLMYYPTHGDRHMASNFAKVQIAPFIAKTKMTVELNGARATVRLHKLTPAIFVRMIENDNEDAALDPSTAETHTELSLVRLEVHGDMRRVSTVAFIQVTGKAARSISKIDIACEQVSGTRWVKITPTQPLPPGEYGLVALPKGQNLIPTRVFEFAIDPTAPRNTTIVEPES